MTKVNIWKGVFYQHISNLNYFIEHYSIILCYCSINFNNPTFHDKSNRSWCIIIYSNPKIKRVMFFNIKLLHFFDCKEGATIICSWDIKACGKCSCKIFSITCEKTWCTICIKKIWCFIKRCNHGTNIDEEENNKINIDHEDIVWKLLKINLKF